MSLGVGLCVSVWCMYVCERVVFHSVCVGMRMCQCVSARVYVNECLGISVCICECVRE